MAFDLDFWLLFLFLNDQQSEESCPARKYIYEKLWLNAELYISMQIFFETCMFFGVWGGINNCAWLVEKWHIKVRASERVSELRWWWWGYCAKRNASATCLAKCILCMPHMYILYSLAQHTWWKWKWKWNWKLKTVWLLCYVCMFIVYVLRVHTLHWTHGNWFYDAFALLSISMILINCWIEIVNQKNIRTIVLKRIRNDLNHKNQCHGRKCHRN